MNPIEIGKWLVVCGVLYYLIGLAIGRVMRNRSKKYGDYSKDWIDSDGFAWPGYVFVWILELVINVVGSLGYWLIVKPMFWIIDKIVPNDDKIYKSKYPGDH